jgi:hypothetical protein
MRCNNAGVCRLILKKTNSFEFIITNGDVGHARGFFALSSGQVEAVEDPVIVTTAVETISFPQTVGKNFLFSCLSPPGTRWGGFLFR